MTDHSVGINKMVDNDIREVAKQAARILIDGKPSRVVPVEPTRGMWAAAGTAVVKTRQRTGNHDDMSQAVYTAMLAASDAALTEAVVKMREALDRAERKLTAYVGVCKGDTELVNTVLPMCRAALARITVETSDG
jgi:hypothetical protein